MDAQTPPDMDNQILNAFRHRKKTRDNNTAMTAQRLVNLFRQLPAFRPEFVAQYNRMLLEADDETQMMMQDIVGGASVRQYLDFVRQAYGQDTQENEDNPELSSSVPNTGYLPTADEDLPFYGAAQASVTASGVSNEAVLAALAAVQQSAKEQTKLMQVMLQEMKNQARHNEMSVQPVYQQPIAAQPVEQPFEYAQSQPAEMEQEAQYATDETSLSIADSFEETPGDEDSFAATDMFEMPMDEEQPADDAMGQETYDMADTEDFDSTIDTDIFETPMDEEQPADDAMGQETYDMADTEDFDSTIDTDIFETPIDEGQPADDAMGQETYDMADTEDFDSAIDTDIFETPMDEGQPADDAMGQETYDMADTEDFDSAIDTDIFEMPMDEEQPADDAMGQETYDMTDMGEFDPMSDNNEPFEMTEEGNDSENFELVSMNDEAEAEYSFTPVVEEEPLDVINFEEPAEEAPASINAKPAPMPTAALPSAKPAAMPKPSGMPKMPMPSFKPFAGLPKNPMPAFGGMPKMPKIGGFRQPSSAPLSMNRGQGGVSSGEDIEMINDVEE